MSTVEAVSISAGEERSLSWLRTWLACLAFFYPLYWASNFIVSASPALIRVAAFGHHIQHFRATFLGADVVTRAPDGSIGVRANPRRGARRWLAETAAVVTVLAGLLAVTGRKYRAASGVAVAMLGNAAIRPWAAGLFYWRRLTPESALGLFFGFVALSLGLRWMLAGGAARGFPARAASLFLAFVLPLAALPMLFVGPGYPWRILWTTAAPAAIASVLVSLRPIGVWLKEPLRVGWWAVAAGAVMSLALVAGVRQQNLAAERSRRASRDTLMASLPKVDPGSPYPKVFFQKGVNFTSEFPSVYGSEGARKMLEGLPKYGVNAIALVPYGFTPRSSPQVRFPGGMESDEGIAELSAVAHHLGIKVLLKPQVWVSPGYPGDLEFASAEDRRKWFEQYRLLVEHYASLSRKIHADVFCVGVEFSKLVKYDAEWRNLIARARALYPGPLVYAANSGPEFETITFWDALDYIGLNNYYPLPDDLSTETVVRTVEAVQRKYQRPVIFTEAGFSSLTAPHSEPWDETPRQLSLDDQARCYEALFQAFYKKPWFQGVYWWKVGSSGSGGPQDGSHTPWGKPAMDVVKKWYVGGGR